MTTFLIAALSVTTLISLVLGLMLYKAMRNAEIDHENQRVLRLMIEDGHQNSRDFAQGITHVLNGYTGGISKRLTESEQIVNVLLRSAPELFIQNPELIYCLHANDQFLMRLYSVASEDVGRLHCHSFDFEPKEGRDSDFFKIYELSGLHPPVFAKKMTATN